MDAASALVESNAKSTRLMFGPEDAAAVCLHAPDIPPEGLEMRLRSKFSSCFRDPVEQYAKLVAHQAAAGDAVPSPPKRPRGAPTGGSVIAVAVEDDVLPPALHVDVLTEDPPPLAGIQLEILEQQSAKQGMPQPSTAGTVALSSSVGGDAHPPGSVVALELARDRPKWHAPWKMSRVIMGHAGWVRSVAVEPGNQWFATGSADRTVKVWDLASGKLKLTLTGHISTVRGIAISDRHPYMFTVGEDKMVKCWDLEQNKVIRHYHGHLSGVYCIALHPTLDVLVTGGRDSAVRVWDMRTKRQVFGLSGHKDTINSVCTQATDPQIISASVDSTVRLWDLAAGKCMTTLTNHKKGVRALALHPNEYSFASASADNIKTWGLPRGDFMRNLSGHKGLVNALAVNEDDVMVSAGDDGCMRFWDYGAAHCFQTTRTIVQPGSLENEAGIYAMAFDLSGSRLITCETDKTIKLWREDEKATPASHPVDWQPSLSAKRY
jgi:pleiotropic regulator 1